MVHSITTPRGVHFGPGSSRNRHDHRGGPSPDTVTSIEREGAGETLRRQPDHDPEVAQAVEYGRCPDGAEGASLDRPDLRGGGDDRRLPAAHRAAAGRLSVWASADDSAPHPIVAASAACPRWKATSQRRSASPTKRSATSISILPRSAPKRASCTCFVAIDRTSKLAFAKLERKQTGTSLPTSCVLWSRPCPSTRS